MPLKSILTSGMMAAIVAMASSAHATTFFATGTGGDGPESAEAIITAMSGGLTIKLSDLEKNVTSAGQEVSGIEIFLKNETVPASVSLTSSAGTLIQFDSKRSGAFTVDTKDTIDHWGVVKAGLDELVLATAGTGAVNGKPVDLIIGPGPYGGTDKVSASLLEHGPSIQNQATFQVSLAGVTDPQVSKVVFEFGTGPDNTLPGLPSDAPEPATWAMMLVGFFGMGAALRARRRTVVA
jgi:hypothetical protein